jgi:predicted Zn-dependent protease with MMP-like domain
LPQVVRGSVVDDEQFERSVLDALERIPEVFRQKMNNVEILVEDFPDADTVSSLSVDSRWELLGLYVGVPVTHQSFFSHNVLPDRIHLYRQPILRAAGNPANVPHVIRDVIIHEVGHHFGFTDDQLYAMAGRVT